MATARGIRLAKLWRDVFVSEAFASDTQAMLQFEGVRVLEMYHKMLDAVAGTARNPSLYAKTITAYNHDKMKLGHFKVNSCGLIVVDLYRMVADRRTKFAT